jgi:hypothetical protein
LVVTTPSYDNTAACFFFLSPTLLTISIYKPTTTIIQPFSGAIGQHWLALFAITTISSAHLQAYGSLTSFHSAEPVTYDCLKATMRSNRKLKVDENVVLWARF